MKLKKKYQIEKAVSKDRMRVVLMDVHIAEDRKHLIATNGTILAKVPVELDETDDRGTAAIPPKVLADARKLAKRGSDTELSLNGTFTHVDGSSVPRPSAEGVGRYPRYEQVIPKDPAIKHSVTLNPELLLALAKALGDGEQVTLEFQDRSEEPVIVRNGDAMGLIMPIKVQVAP